MTSDVMVWVSVALFLFGLFGFGSIVIALEHHAEQEALKREEAEIESRPVMQYVVPQPRKHKKPTLDESGFVYLLKASTGQYKIGKTVKVEKRKRWIDIHVPFELELIHAIPCKNRHKAETTIKKRYRSQVIKGEWFLLSPEDVEAIKSIKEM